MHNPSKLGSMSTLILRQLVSTDITFFCLPQYRISVIEMFHSHLLKLLGISRWGKAEILRHPNFQLAFKYSYVFTHVNICNTIYLRSAICHYIYAFPSFENCGMI